MLRGRKPWVIIALLWLVRWNTVITYLTFGKVPHRNSPQPHQCSAKPGSLPPSPMTGADGTTKRAFPSARCSPKKSCRCMYLCTSGILVKGFCDVTRRHFLLWDPLPSLRTCMYIQLAFAPSTYLPRLDVRFTVHHVNWPPFNLPRSHVGPCTGGRIAPGTIM